VTAPAVRDQPHRGPSPFSVIVFSSMTGTVTPVRHERKGGAVDQQTPSPTSRIARAGAHRQVEGAVCHCCKSLVHQQRTS
jgi:hypothetical protein